MFKVNDDICVVCEYGWIIKGKVAQGTSDAELVLADSSVVRRWTNGLGIGGIAKVEHKDDYTLDVIGDVVIKQSKVLFAIPCEW